MLFRSALVAVREERRIKTTAAAQIKAKQEQGRPTETATTAEEDQPQRSAPEAEGAPLPDGQHPEAPSPQEAPWSPGGVTSTDAHNLVEHPVYFVSMVLWDARAWYPMPQKLLLALLVASRELRHYFQGHPIKVVSSYPLERVLRSPNSAGRVAEGNIELQAFSANSARPESSREQH